MFKRFKERQRQAAIQNLKLRIAELAAKVEYWENKTLVKGGGLPYSIVTDIQDWAAELAVAKVKLSFLEDVK